ncbi:MAG: magnesium chelatase subunit D [Minwuia sp.]|uniref:magnesium chelatase subunit D n=1 Tax=Minwuia sp. TaxID=2493630 RepID=UPI003A87A524
MGRPAAATDAAALPWIALEVLAVDPSALGGAVIKGMPHEIRRRWLACLNEVMSEGARLMRMPVGITEDRLLGGLDLSATLARGRPVFQSGILEEVSGGLVHVGMAERIEPRLAGLLGAAMDNGLIPGPDGIARPVSFGVIAFDEGVGDETPPPGLSDRLGLCLHGANTTVEPPCGVEEIRSRIDDARRRQSDIETPAELPEVLSAVALSLGIESLRAPMQALKAARIIAALDGSNEVADFHVALAVQLVLAGRATRMPSEEEPAEQPDEPEMPEEPESEDANAEDGQAVQDRLLELVEAILPDDLLLALRSGERRRNAQRQGKAGAFRKSGRRGRPVGSRRGDPRSDGRLDLMATLRAAAPWQALRRGRDAGPALRVHMEDLRVKRFRERSETTTIFAVDASGSAAVHRLAEAKGAVERLLADCYIRRDRVALIAFRGAVADLVLPPTGSLTRAKRLLATVPGGGGTPLASGIEAATALAVSIESSGATPLIVLLTDGRANIGRDGAPGRAQAAEDATAAARVLRVRGIRSLLIDVSPRPRTEASRLAAEMGADYLPLPYADPARLDMAIRNAAQPAGKAA